MAGGKASFTLKHGQSIPIKDLPSNIEIKIAEASAASCPPPRGACPMQKEAPFHSMGRFLIYR
jgi:hypothetical protein